MTLTDFLLQRIAEDEAVARAALREPGAGWMADGYGEVFESRDFFAADRCSEHPPGVPNMCDDERVADGLADDDAPALEAARGAHIARHDPARVLAECAAKRAIVEECSSYLNASDYTNTGGYHEVLQVLASVYADHPDYCEPGQWPDEVAAREASERRLADWSKDHPLERTESGSFRRQP